jgi:oligoribonuclease
MPQDASRLIWIDMEMTGLKPDGDRIIEIALVVTDGDLVTVAEAPVWVVRQTDEVLAGMDAWNQGTHGRSGLVGKVKASPHDESTVESAALDFPARACARQGVADVRQFDLPGPALPRALDARARGYFHYRNLDVSTLKELARRWKPELMKGVPKEGKHEALADVYESIAELKYYRENLHPHLSVAQSLRASRTPSPTVTRHASTRESSRISR